jgi:hypothetical protein
MATVTATSSDLRAAAFGGSPDAAVRVGRRPLDRWLAAVVLGGRGHYAAAATQLARVLADPRAPAGVRAHAAVTRAAHRRQIGGHAAARRDDALGLRLASTATGQPDAEGTDAWAAKVDALIGLVADAVGLGEGDLAERLLAVAQRAGQGHPSWRLPVRAGWVRAELALVTGRPGAAVEPAARALENAKAGGSLRHVLKSRIVLAVARAAAGELDPTAALGELDAVAADCCGLGLLPLLWPCELAAADLLDACSASGTRIDTANDGSSGRAHTTPNGAPNDATRRRHAAAATVSVLYQQNDPLGRRLMGESQWLPRQLPVTSLLHTDLRHPHDECHSAQHSRMEGTNPP